MSCAVTAQLICVFVFAYAKNRFSQDAAQFSSSAMLIIGMRHEKVSFLHIYVTAQLGNAFVFATQIVQSLYFLNPKPSTEAVQLGLC